MNERFISKTVWGLLLIGAGVLFLLNQTGTVSVDPVHLIVDYWPVLLIYFGLKGILIQRKLEYGWGGSYIWNIFIALIGTYFLLRNLDIDILQGLDLWQFAVPVILILVGLNMLTKGPGSKHEERRAALREEHRQRREAHREQRHAMRTAHMEAKYKAKMARKYPMEPQAPEENGGAAIRPEEEPAEYDPAYTRKIERDLDHVFHERVVKKLGDDPFPLVSDAQAGSGAATKGTIPPEPDLHGIGGAANPGGFPPPPPPPPPPPNGPEWHSGWEAHHRRPVDRSNFIGDIHLGHDYWELEPTNVSHFIGDTVIDLTKARIPYGETKLTVSSFIGDVKVFVPNDVQVEISVTASAFIGDMKVLDRHEGGMFRHMKYDTKHYVEAEKKINLTVSMFIGDVFIKRVG
ncbi:cell wall-active antibiotics response protein LiaF [Gorillibacterium sp. sgz5001074]|uniref:cell wall-active antibiotics response protein LiaF n=1 Tax=Gorillibacterium sp. sgz5001074 TaxID=3446695 RepID=UPI003F66A0EC